METAAMSRRREPQQANLFELEAGIGEAPLGDEPEVDVADAVAEAEQARAPRRGARQAEREESPAETGPPSDDVAGFGRRFLGAVLDVVLQALVGLAAVAGAQAIGAAPVPRAMPGFALLLLVFSLVYTVIPLAFWGRTPGMRAVGLVAHTGDEHPLTFA